MDTDTLHFRVRSSSSDEVYEVVASFTPRLRITCTCQGHLKGAACKHRTALLLEDASSAVDVNLDDLKTLTERAKASSLGEAMQEMTSLEAEADKIKKRITAQKKKIARLLNGEEPSKAAYAARY